MENETSNIPPVQETGRSKTRTILIVVLSVLVVAAIILATINFFSSWRCVSGEWMRDGFPLSRKPSGQCLENAKTVSEEKKEEAVATAVKETPEKNYVVLADELELSSPKKGELVSSPLEVKGRAKGTWFFEGSFPLKLTNSSGNVIFQGYTDISENWMSEGWVDFSATLDFSAPNDGEGFLVLEKDNPSGLSEKDKAVSVPVKFTPNNGEKIFIPNNAYDNKCGGFLADEKILGDCGEDCNTDNWKVYENKKYGYSFRYPADYTFTNSCKSANCVSEQDGGDSVSLSGDRSENGWPLIEIRHFSTDAYNPPVGTSYVEWVKKNFSWTKDCFPDAANIYFTKEKGNLLSGFDLYFPASPQSYSTREIYYEYQGKLFQIVMLDVNTPQARQFYNIWLSTFSVSSQKNT